MLRRVKRALIDTHGVNGQLYTEDEPPRLYVSVIDNTVRDVYDVMDDACEAIEVTVTGTDIAAVNLKVTVDA